MVLEIARRFINGEWKTTALEDDGGGGSQPVLASTVLLSSADILALDTTPVTIVAAVAGQIIVPVSLTGVLHYGTTTYSLAGSARAFIGATTFGSSGWGSLITSVGIGATVSAAAFVTFQPLEGDAEALTLLTGKPLRFDQTGPVATGDGTFSITTVYYLVTP